MFNFDRWREIFDTLMRSKLRTALTAFSMAWGIFMLVVLLGLGNGLQHGVEANFADDAINSIWVRAGTTSVAHEGMPLGRRVMFDNKDVDTVRALPESDKVTGRFYIGGWTSSPDLPTITPGGGAYFQPVLASTYDSYIARFTTAVTCRGISEIRRGEGMEKIAKCREQPARGGA